MRPQLSQGVTPVPLTRIIRRIWGVFRGNTEGRVLGAVLARKGPFGPLQGETRTERDETPDALKEQGRSTIGPAQLYPVRDSNPCYQVENLAS